MPDSPSSPKSASATAAAAKQPTLLPQGEHAGKPAMPLGTRQLTLIGSRNRSHLHLLSTTISRNHACIVMTKGGPYIRDLASRTGVLLNGRKVKESDLHDGDLLQVGSFKFKFQDPGGSIRLPAAPRPPLAMLEMGGRSMTPLDERAVLIGRRPGCDITLDSPAVSNTHAVIFECDGKRYVRDLGSRTGTQVNGTTVHQQGLELGDQINVGGTTFRYMAADMPLGEGDLSDADLPLAVELEHPSAAPEHVATEDLDFEELEHAPVHTPPPLEPEEEEAIPLVQDEPTSLPAGLEDHPEASPIPVEAEVPAAAPQEGSAPVATTEDLGLDFLAPEGEQNITAHPPEEGPAGIDFVSEAAAAPVVESITELSSVGFPLVEPEDEFHAAPSGLIQEVDAPAEPIATEPADEVPAVEEPAPQPTSEFLASEPEPTPVETPALAEAAPAIEPPSEATLALVLPPAEHEVVSAVEEAHAVESTEPLPVEPEASPIQLEDWSPENAATEPMPEPAVSATETPATESGITIAPAEAAHVTEAAEITSETPSDVEPLLGANEANEVVAEPEESPAAPLRVEDVDLSAVKFETKGAEAEAAAEADESAAEPAPLLDLATEESATEVPDEVVETAEVAEVPAPGKPKSRSARRRRARARRKKGEPTTAANLAAATETAAGLAEASELSTGELGTETLPATSEPSAGEAEVASETAEAADAGIAPVASDTTEAGAPAEAERVSAAGTEVAIASDAGEGQHRAEASERVSVEALQESEAVSERGGEGYSELEGASLAKPQAAEPGDVVGLTGDVAAVGPVAGESLLADAAAAEVAPPMEITAAVTAADEAGLAEQPIETIEQTEPTLESALDLEPALDEGRPSVVKRAEGAEPIMPAEAALSDTAFGEAVHDFTRPDLGPLVEEPPAAAAPHETANASIPPPSRESEAVAHETSTGAATVPTGEPGPELAFGGDERLTAQAHEPAAHEELHWADLEESHETPGASATAPAADAPLELRGGTEFHLDLPADIGAEALPEPALEFGEPGDIDDELPPLDLGDEESLALEGEPFAQSQAAEAPAAPDLHPAMEARSPGHHAAGAETRAVTSEPAIAPTPVEPAASDAAPAEAPAAPRPRLNPFFGMQRDMGSFIGGLPLSLNPPGPASDAAAMAATAPVRPVPTPPMDPAPTPAPAAPVAPGATAAPAAGAKPAAQQAGHDLDLDKLFEGEEPLELFDETAEQLDKLPDTLAPISDVSGALAEPTSAPAAPAAAPTIDAPAPLRTLTADPASAAAQPAATTKTAPIPPFAGAAPPPRRPGMRAFSGLGGVKPTDVFSQTAFPPLDESAFKPQPIEGLAAETQPAVPVPGHVPPAAGAAPLESLAAALKKPGDVSPRPPERPAAAEPPRRRPWYKNLRVLLPLLIVLLAAAAFAIIWFFPPKTLVQGTLQIKGTDNSTADVWARHEQVTQVRNALKDSGLQSDVLSNLGTRSIAPGFLQDRNAFVALAEPSNSPFENGRLLLRRPLSDAQDAQRMQAILEVIYLRYKTPAEQASQAPGQAADAAQKVAALQERLKSQQEQAKTLSNDLTVKAGAAASGLLSNPETAVATLERQGAALQKALDQATDVVRRRHEAWEKAQAASQKAVVDPKVTQLRQDLAGLNAQLSVEQVARSGRVDPAKALDGAVNDISDELALIAPAMAGVKGSAVAEYVATARGAATEIHSLITQQKQDADQIAMLRQQLAEHREAHLRQVWTGDDTLKGLLEERDAQSHRYSVASDSGYAEDARRIQGVLEQLDQKIEDRRQTLATAGQSSDETQQKLEGTIGGLEDERQQSATKIADAMARLQLPSTSKMSASDNAILVGLAKDVAAAQAQHDIYAGDLAGKRPAGDADAEIHKLQARIAEKQAQLDAYQQRPDAPAEVADARKALDESQDAQARAQQALADNFDQLMLARQLRDAKAKLDGIQQDLAAQHEAQGKVAQAAAAVPVVLEPDDAAVQVVRDEDPRVTYLAAALGAIVAVFAIPLWLAIRAPEEDMPYAQLMAEPREAFGQRGEDLEPVDDLLPDEEHPAFT